MKVIQSKSESKVLKFREKRISIPEDVESKFEINDSHVGVIRGNVLNISNFGARIELKDSDALLRIGQRLESISITIAGETIYSLDAIVSNELASAETIVKYGITLCDSADVGRIAPFIVGDALVENFASNDSIFSRRDLILPDFKLLISDLSTLFQEIKLKLNKEQKKIIESSPDPLVIKVMEDHTTSVAAAIYSKHILQIFSELAALVAQMSSTERVAHKQYFRTNFHPLLLGAGFVQRSFEKPLGYAGDFGLMTMLYYYQDVGHDLFSKFFHRYACSSPAAMANRNRVDYLAFYFNKILKTFSKQKANNYAKIVSLACGPAEELCRLIRLEDSIAGIDKIDILCLDQEQLALDYAQKSLRPLSVRKKNINIDFFQEDVVAGVIKGKLFTKNFDDSFIIYSAGLFDYLSDRVFSLMVDILVKKLLPGGYVIIGNVSDSNPDTFIMDFLMEWHLVLRSKERLLSLVSEKVKATCNVEVISESLGLNLFLIIHKKDIDE